MADTVGPILCGWPVWLSPDLVSAGAQLILRGLCEHCVIIPYGSPRTAGCRALRPCLPQTTVIPKAKQLHYSSQATLDKLPSQSHVLLKACCCFLQAAMLSGSPFLAAYFYHDLLYSPCFHLAKDKKHLFFSAVTAAVASFQHNWFQPAEAAKGSRPLATSPPSPVLRKADEPRTLSDPGPSDPH